MLVCAPHANQFIDAVVISTHLPRKIYYIGAASSFRKYKVVGFFMKLMASIIPVERQQDVKKALSGTMTVRDDHILVMVLSSLYLREEILILLQKWRWEDRFKSTTVPTWLEAFLATQTSSLTCPSRSKTPLTKTSIILEL